MAPDSKLWGAVFTGTVGEESVGRGQTKGPRRESPAGSCSPASQDPGYRTWNVIGKETQTGTCLSRFSAGENL